MRTATLTATLTPTDASMTRLDTTASIYARSLTGCSVAELLSLAYDAIALTVVYLIAAYARLTNVATRQVRVIRQWCRDQRDYSRYCASVSDQIRARTQAYQSVSPCGTVACCPVSGLQLAILVGPAPVPYASVAAEGSVADCAILTDRDLVSVPATLPTIAESLASGELVECGGQLLLPLTTTAAKKLSKSRKPATQRVSRAANKPVARPDYATMTYRELQTAAKAKGIRANQTRLALIAALSS